MKWIIAALFSVYLAVPALAEVFIKVDISDQVMYVDAPDFSQIWEVSTGKKGKSTPPGYYQPYLMKKMHYSSKYHNAPMPYSIFYEGGYAIHGTESIGKLGSRASNGCVRLHPENARFLFRLVSYYGKENTHIEIVP